MKTPHSSGTLGRLAMLGNHAPRQCGIATFTTDLTEAIAAAMPFISRTALFASPRRRR